MPSITTNVLLFFLIHIIISHLHYDGTYAAISTNKAAAEPPVQLSMQNGFYVLYNGILCVYISNPSGMVTKISYNGIDNLLEERKSIYDRGYWDISGGNGEERLGGTRSQVVVHNEKQVELSFTTTYIHHNHNNNSNANANANGGSTTPINVDKRFVMLRGSSGFYTYTVLERLKGWPSMIIQEARIVFKLLQTLTYYMAMSEERQRIMPTLADRNRGKTLAYREAVQLLHPSNPHFNREVDDKYFYSCDNKDNQVYGWVSLSQSSPTGFWMINPSNEFRTGGPFKQDLTSHVGPIILNMFVSTHYTGKDLSIEFSKGEAWKKVLGPVFVYLNSNKPHAAANTHVDPSLLWKDAKNTMYKEVAKWPYQFPYSPDFIKSNQRGLLKGRLLVLDRYVNHNFEDASFAYVGLALPGAAGSWQRDSKGYQFWSKCDSRGNFKIKNVIAGTYALYASVPGRIGDYKYSSNNTVINPGSNVDVGNLVYEPPRNGPTLWEIGIPDRTAAEFFIPNPDPTFKVHVYKHGQSDRFREYGLWKRYTELYPVNDLVYTIGVSNYTKDWFFAQVTRLAKDINTYVSTTWRIIFDLPVVLHTNGKYTLRIALASASLAELQVRFNDEHTVKPHFTTGLIGDDNTVARHGIHGLYWLYSIDIDNSLLIKGRNTIFLKQARAGNNTFRNIMYDYIRLEAPAK